MCESKIFLVGDLFGEGWCQWKLFEGVPRAIGPVELKTNKRETCEKMIGSEKNCDMQRLEID